MASAKDILRSEFLAGRTVFDWCFLFLGIAVQVVVFTLQPDTPISLVCGITGIIAVILCAQGKISTFLFGFIQIGTYLYLSLVERLYGEVALNVFYFVSQLYAVYVWRRHYRIRTETRSAELQPRRLKAWVMCCIMAAVLLLSSLTGLLLSRFTDDTQPWLDAFTTVPALFAQVLLMLAYREQWPLWLMVDVLSAVMWARAGNWCLFAQYVFWCANCIYGWRRWASIEE